VQRIIAWEAPLMANFVAVRVVSSFAFVLAGWW
jgi:hypothetical protein